MTEWRRTAAVKRALLGRRNDMKREWTRRLAALISCAACLTALLPVSAAQNEPAASNETAAWEADPADNSYADYLEQHEAAGYAQTAISIPAAAYAAAEKAEGKKKEKTHRAEAPDEV